MAARSRPLVRRTVVAAVQDELKRMAERSPEILGSALAALAVALAREVDDPGNSATSKSMCAGRLIDAVDRLRAAVPAEVPADGLDDLAARRDRRLESVKP